VSIPKVLPGKLAVRAPARQQPPGAVTEPDGSRPVCPRVRARSAVTHTTHGAGAGIITGAGCGTTTLSAVPGRQLTLHARSVTARNRTWRVACARSITGAGIGPAIRWWYVNGLRKQASSISIGEVMQSSTAGCIFEYVKNAVRLQPRFARTLTRRAKVGWNGRISRMSILVSKISCRCASHTMFGMTGRLDDGV